MPTDRPSQRPTLRAPAPGAGDFFPLGPSPRRERRVPFGQALVGAVGLVCGALLGAGFVLSQHRPPPRVAASPVAPDAQTAGARSMISPIQTPSPGARSDATEAAPPRRVAARPAAAEPRRVPAPTPEGLGDTALVRSGALGARPAPTAATEPAPRARPSRLQHEPELVPELLPAPEGHTLEQARVRRIVAASTPEMRRCYTAALRRTGASARARVSVTLDVAPTGAVRDVGVEGTDLEGMHECVARTAARWRFPHSPRGARLPLSFLFAPRES